MSFETEKDDEISYNDELKKEDEDNLEGYDDDDE